MKVKSSFLLFTLFFILTSLSAQVAINSDNSAPDNSAMLDVSSTSAGFLLPRMTEVQMNAIVAPAEGLIIYNTDEHCFKFWDGIQWNILGCPLPEQPSVIVGETVPSVGTTGTYSVTEVSDVNYAWTVPADWTIDSGQGTQSITVTVGEDSGDISVTPSNDCGNGIARTLSVNPTLYAPGTVFCASGSTAIVDVTNPATGDTWMDRNLGASQQATSSTDASAYGDLYQWGRFSDGHQCRTSGTTSTLSSTDTPGHGDFIVTTSTPYDWRQGQNDNLWQGLGGTNNPCPAGYRLPTEAEWEAERASWSSNDAAGAYASPLKLTLAGHRNALTGVLTGVGSTSNYWSSTAGGIQSGNLNIASSHAYISDQYRGIGYSVRCIKD